MATFGAAKRQVPDPDDLVDADRDASSRRSILQGAASVMIDWRRSRPRSDGSPDAAIVTRPYSPQVGCVKSHRLGSDWRAYAKEMVPKGPSGPGLDRQRGMGANSHCRSRNSRDLFAAVSTRVHLLPARGLDLGQSPLGLWKSKQRGVQIVRLRLPRTRLEYPLLRWQDLLRTPQRCSQSAR